MIRSEGCVRRMTMKTVPRSPPEMASVRARRFERGQFQSLRQHLKRAALVRLEPARGLGNFIIITRGQNMTAAGAKQQRRGGIRPSGSRPVDENRRRIVGPIHRPRSGAAAEPVGSRCPMATTAAEHPVHEAESSMDRQGDRAAWNGVRLQNSGQAETRSQGDITQKRQVLGIPSAKPYRRWTPEEIK